MTSSLRSDQLPKGVGEPRRKLPLLSGCFGSGMSLPVLSFGEFAALRIADFLKDRGRIVVDPDWQWMDGRWIYEGIGFTWFGRLHSAPDVTAGLEISFSELNIETAEHLLAALRLQLQVGMSREDIQAVLGDRYMTRVFVDDRVTDIYRVGKGDVFELSCTVQNESGLIHLSMIRNDVRRRLAKRSR